MAAMNMMMKSSNISTSGSVLQTPNVFSTARKASSLALPVSARMLQSATLRKSKRAMRVRCDFIGSPTNLIMVTSTTLMLLAGRFGLAPSANRKSTAGLKLQDRDSGLQTGDPAGFTGTDTLACGALGHIIGVGIVLGLKAIGSI